MDLEHHMKFQKIEVMDYSEFARLLDWDKVQEFRNRALNPNSPVTRGSAQMMTYISKLERLKIFSRKSS